MLCAKGVTVTKTVSIMDRAGSFLFRSSSVLETRSENGLFYVTEQEEGGRVTSSFPLDLIGVVRETEELPKWTSAFTPPTNGSNGSDTRDVYVKVDGGEERLGWCSDPGSWYIYDRLSTLNNRGEYELAASLGLVVESWRDITEHDWNEKGPCKPHSK